MPDENSLDDERELCAAESLLPYCTLRSAKLIMNAMIAPTNAKIETKVRAPVDVLGSMVTFPPCWS
jgi:hypothetical protein